jgi:branched-chain amino acid aminotransferase
MGKKLGQVVYFNGKFVLAAEARVSIYDSALVMGDMAYEVTRTCHGRPFRLPDHVERLFHTLRVLRIDPGLTREELEQITLETLHCNAATERDDMDWNIIHNVSRGPAAAFVDAFPADERRPTVIVSCRPLAAKLAALAPLYDRGIDLVVPEQRSLPGDLLDAALKTRSRLHYQLANLEAEARAPGAWAVLVDPAGYLTECTSGNLFVVRGGRLLTPEARNLLPGITRGIVLELAGRLGIPADETDLTVPDALSADEIFVTSTTIGMLHAKSWGGRPIGDGQAGPLMLRLRREFMHDVGLDFVAQARHYGVTRR